MKSLPKISIIVPIYNVEPYIAECVQSVMRQTYKGEIECILVDDCGKDRSTEIAEQLINTYNDEKSRGLSSLNEPHSPNGGISFRILHHERNRGLSAARNTGTDAATGDYIYYLDSDDYISDDCIEVLTQPLREFEYDMVIGGMKTFGVSRHVESLKKATGAVLSNKAILRAWYGDNPLYGMAWNRLVKRSLFAEHDMSFLEGQLHEDELWTYKCCIVLQSLYVQNYITYFYRLRKDSVIGTRLENSEKLAQSLYASIDYVLSHPAKVEIEIWNRIVCCFFGAYLSASIQLFKNTWPQYRDLRKRFDYHPLLLWKQGKMSLKDVKHQLHYALPPFLGYIYMKIRKLKQTIL